MKKTIQIIVTEKKILDVEVDFPIYRHHFGDYWDSYTRIDFDLRYWTIQHNYYVGTNEWVIEVLDKYIFDGSCADYHLGNGMYACSAEDFYRAINHIKKQLHTVPDLILSEATR